MTNDDGEEEETRVGLGDQNAPVGETRTLRRVSNDKDCFIGFHRNVLVNIFRVGIEREQANLKILVSYNILL